MRGRIDMNPNERASKLIETFGYTNALKFAKKTRDKQDGWFRYHKWEKVYNKIKQHDSKGL